MKIFSFIPNLIFLAKNDKILSLENYFNKAYCFGIIIGKRCKNTLKSTYIFLIYTTRKFTLLSRFVFSMKDSKKY